MIAEAEDEEALSVDTDYSLFESDRADNLAGYPQHHSYTNAPTDDAMDASQAESSASDFMELDPPASDALIGSDMRRMQHERNHYKQIVAQLQDSPNAEAEALFRRLREASHRNIFQDSLPMRGDEMSTYGSSRTLLEISTSIRTPVAPRTSWLERDGSGNGPPLSTTSPRAAQQSTTNVWSLPATP
jgi:hypothetical protein